MNKSNNSNSCNAVTALNIISQLVQDIEKKLLEGNVKARECEELKLLKEKCCDNNAIISLCAFQGIESLVHRKILIGSQTISMLISLLPSINQYGGLVSTIGRILLQSESEIFETKTWECPYGAQILHPFVIIFKFCPEKSWFEIYNFILQLIQINEEIKIESKIKFLRPILRYIFWDSPAKGTRLEMKLVDALMLQLHHREYLDFTLEALLWQPLDMHYSMNLQEIFQHVLTKRNNEVICGVTPSLALAAKWLILNGHEPTLWLNTLKKCCEAEKSTGSVVLYILSEAITETPCTYINALIDVCKFIIEGAYCSKYVAYKFVAVALNWLVSPSFLANPIYETVEELIEFITEDAREWKDQTAVLNGNEYYRVFGRSRAEVRFAVELILSSNRWIEGKAEGLVTWLRNLCKANEHRTLLRVHSFVQGLILCERDRVVVGLCLDLVSRLIGERGEISLSHLCLLFYKLGRETDPTLQRTFLFSLPKLASRKENIPLIVGIIESLKRGSPKIMTPLVVQLYLSLWKADSRTYSYLHATLHDGTPRDFAWDLNVSRALALRDICRLAPHLHAKDSVGVLSSILNECAGDVNGLPSAVAIEAVTELCKAYVIDAAGTWSAIQPKLRLDKRTRVIKSLCSFFGEIPNLNFSEQKGEDLTKDIVQMLWNYTFFTDREVTRCAFRALSKFPLESLPLNLLPETYRINIKLPKDFDKNAKASEDLLSLPYVPAQCWVQFLAKIPLEVLKDGGELVITLLERELASMPRGLFYLPPEQTEPPSYSYLPPRSLCRALFDHLHRSPAPTARTAQILAVLAHGYSKLLPPLDWRFLENLWTVDAELFRHCFALLAKQGAVSASARLLLDDHFKSTQWESLKSEEILFIYNLLPTLCKSVSYNVLQNFMESTLGIILQAALEHDTPHFENVLKVLAELLRNKTAQLSHKTLVVRQLEKLLTSIPPDREAMRHFARCATEFPMKSIEQMTSCRSPNEVDGDWLRRAVCVKWAIALRADIKDPMSWFTELTQVAPHFPNEGDFLLKAICAVIRERKDCDHRIWLQELSWRVQASIVDSSAGEETSVRVTLFLIDVFLSATVTLSGLDSLLSDEEVPKTDLFPQALSALLSFPDWSDMLPKVGIWLENLLKWKGLPRERARTLVRALFCLREIGGPPSCSAGYVIE